MGEAFIVRRGGKATTFAVIGVTFPSGSTVSCAKGSVLLERMGSGTSAFFNVPEAGTWVVTITDGNKVKSQSVEVTAAGQVEKLAMVYGLELISNGVVQSPSEWTAADMTSQAGNGYVDLTMSHASFQQGMYVIPVNLTEYSKLTIEAYNAGSTDDQHPNFKWLKAAIKQTTDPSEPQISGEYINLETIGSKTTLELNVSSKNGTWYVGFYGHGLDATSDPSQPLYLESIARVYNMSLS